MAKQIAKLLKASIQETSDLKEIARMLSKKGRGGDTMLAHITPKEAALLKESGGAGTVNPDTGLLEFYDDFDFDTGSYGRSSSYYTPRESSSDLSTYYRSPSEDVIGNIASSAPPDTYTPAGQSYNLMQFGASPNVQTGGYEQPAYTPAGGPALDLTQMGGAYDPRTGGMTGYGTPYTFEGRPSAFPISEEAQAISPLISPETTPPTPPSLVDRALVGPTKSAFEYLKENVTPTEALRLGTAAFGAVQGRRAMQEAQRQREQSVAEQRALGDPYKKMGSELQRQAQSGEMTPQSAQAFQALRAQLAQGVETRGGVGAAQAQAQLEMFRNNLLQNQFNYGLQVSQIGDQIALGAIRTGMQLDRQLLEANQNFYTNLAGFAAGGIPQGQQGRRF